MARYNKIDLGPARKNDPQVTELEAGVAIVPGSLVVVSSGRFALADASTVGKVWLAQENYLAMRGVDAAYKAYAAGPPIVNGDTVLGIEWEADKHYAVRIATGVNITAIGTKLTPGAGGTLAIASTSDLVVAYADEVYNNNTGVSQLVRVRPAGSASYLSAA